ncbi:MAG: hypothetical protein Q4F38_03455 [Akkermansia sp.]|nr:hypothetical protein [Akkermansia sp.]
MSEKLKIGIIQNAPLTADFPNNLRQIVQGYRECLDHGAELVVAPATALCGAEPLDLIERQSFMQQTEAALNALSRELGEVPLILGAWAPQPDDLFDNDLDCEKDAPEPRVNDAPDGCGTILTPYLLENNDVTELENGEIIDLDGVQIYTDTKNALSPDDTEGASVIVHLRTAPWHAGAQAEDEDDGTWEARTAGIPVISVRHVGSTHGNIYAGGSAVYSAAGRVTARLPMFEPAARVVDVYSTRTAKARPTEEEQLCSALELGIRDTVRNNGFSGVCLSLDTPNAALLAALCTEALGRSNVVGVTTQNNTQIAEALKISCHKPDIAPLLAAAEKVLPDAAEDFRKRITATALYSFAESRGLMFLSPLSRREFMLGSYTQYGESCGHFAPLGNLYEIDLHMLRVYLSEKYATLFGVLSEPAIPATDRIIHELADRNLSASALLHSHTCPFSENEVRLVQRKLIASALKRTQMPPVLHADRVTERIDLPVAHRMND